MKAHVFIPGGCPSSAIISLPSPGELRGTEVLQREAGVGADLNETKWSMEMIEEMKFRLRRLCSGDYCEMLYNALVPEKRRTELDAAARKLR